MTRTRYNNAGEAARKLQAMLHILTDISMTDIEDEVEDHLSEVECLLNQALFACEKVQSDIDEQGGCDAVDYMMHDERC